MENYFKNLKISDFSLFKHFTNHRLPLNNYQTGTIHTSLSRDIIQSEEIILDSFFKNTIQKIEYHILEVLFSKFKSSLRERILLIQDLIKNSVFILKDSI